MDMSGPSSSSHACKISMLWNWYTIDACFLSKSWQIKSHGMFAGSCIGVAALVVALEALRRFAREYDAFIVRQFRRNVNTRGAAVAAIGRGDECGSDSVNASVTLMFRATPLQQLVRAVVHAVLFGLAYIVMLLAMYYNGYIIISIFIGAGIGKFLCDWLVVSVVVANAGACASRTDREEGERLAAKMDTGVPQEASICCG